MTRAFIELPLFQSKWKSLGLDDNDLRRLIEIPEEQLKQNEPGEEV